MKTNLLAILFTVFVSGDFAFAAAKGCWADGAITKCKDRLACKNEHCGNSTTSSFNTTTQKCVCGGTIAPRSAGAPAVK